MRSWRSLRTCPTRALLAIVRLMFMTESFPLRLQRWELRINQYEKVGSSFYKESILFNVTCTIQGHEAAFDHVDMLCPPDEYSNPPSLSLAPQTPSHLAPSPPNSPPTGTPTLSTASTSRRAPRAMPNYSYGCLMKKWSL